MMNFVFLCRVLAVASLVAIRTVSAADLNVGIKGITIGSSKAQTLSILQTNYGISLTGASCNFNVGPDNPGYGIYDDHCSFIAPSSKSTYAGEPLAWVHIFLIEGRLKSLQLLFSASGDEKEHLARAVKLSAQLAEILGQPVTPKPGMYIWLDEKKGLALKVYLSDGPNAQKAAALEYADWPSLKIRLQAANASELKKRDM